MPPEFENFFQCGLDGLNLFTPPLVRDACWKELPAGLSSGTKSLCPAKTPESIDLKCTRI